MKNKKKSKILLDKQKTMKNDLNLKIQERIMRGKMKKIKNEMSLLLKNSKKKLKNIDLENLKIDQKYGYQYEIANYLDDDING
jgi:hypothetical protein